jgi:drug/metabolite transporter (DMT)-like permease
LAQPLITFVWFVLLMGEQLSLVALATALVVLACIATTQRSRA